MRFERRLLLLSLGAALPALATALTLLWIVDLSNDARIALAAALLGATLFIVKVMHHRLTFPMRTLANVVGAMREDDYSLRARRGRSDDAFGELAEEINRLSDWLRERHLGGLESAALVRAILAQLDAAIFLFDAEGRLQQLNRAAERLIRVEAGETAGMTIESLGLQECFADPLPSSVELTFAGGSGRWAVRRSSFRDQGRTHSLLAISDVSRALRDEELLAWQRLVRVLSHELNNSLASIHSTAGTLRQIVSAEEPPADWRDDTRRGLTMIAQRAESLTRFMRSYARLARLPRPNLQATSVEALVRRVAGLVFALPIQVEAGAEVMVQADADQVEQLLINLVQNAVDASLETNGTVTITWRVHDSAVQIAVLDEGPGLASTKNLFVPFFTTKPEGTGIGLVLSRQIAEAHNGSLTLQNRPSAGCEAILRLPV